MDGSREGNFPALVTNGGGGCLWVGLDLSYASTGMVIARQDGGVLVFDVARALAFEPMGKPAFSVLFNRAREIVSIIRGEMLAYRDRCDRVVVTSETPLWRTMWAGPLFGLGFVALQMLGELGRGWDVRVELVNTSILTSLLWSARVKGEKRKARWKKTRSVQVADLVLRDNSDRVRFCDVKMTHDIADALVLMLYIYRQEEGVDWKIPEGVCVKNWMKKFKEN